MAAKMIIIEEEGEGVSTPESSVIQSHGTKTTITRLVTRRQWSLLDKLMRCDNSDIPIDDEISIGGQNSIPEDLIVHFICRFQAPLYIVVLFEKMYPESFLSFDDMGRYPLHIACAWGNSLDTIKFLVDSYPVAARIQDFHGKCAIHHLCRSFKQHYQDTSSILSNDSIMDIVESLYTAAPMSFNVEDNDGKNALEYAIESDFDMKIIRAMQRACRDTWREMKKRSKNKPHDALQMDLQRIQRDIRNQQISSNYSNTDSRVSKENSPERVPISEGRLDIKDQFAKMA